MRIAFFSSKPHDRDFFSAANTTRGHELVFHETRLDATTAPLAANAQAVCAFVNDDLGEATLQALNALGIRDVALRSAGYNNADLAAATTYGMRVVRVPTYSPHAVAEHTVGLMLALNRRIHRAWNRVREGNFSLDGLLGFDMHGKTVGIIGTGNIGSVVARILLGMGCRVLALDPVPDTKLESAGVVYVNSAQLFADSDIVSLHCPLTPETHHLIDDVALERMRQGAMLINTSRGAVVDTRAVIQALKSGKLGYLGLDVYEEEGDLFFENLSDKVIADDIFMRLTTFPNVLVTGHQGFFTREALVAIAAITLDNLECLEREGTCANRLA